MVEEPLDEEHEHRVFRIQIDREHFEVTKRVMTGAELRALPTPPIGTVTFIDSDVVEVFPASVYVPEPDGEVVKLKLTETPSPT